MRDGTANFGPTGLGAGDPTYPHGCYFKKGNDAGKQLFVNPVGDKNDDDTSRVSLCKCIPLGANACPSDSGDPTPQAVYLNWG